MRLTWIRAIAIVVALPVFCHAHLLLGMLVADPIYRFGNLGTFGPGWLGGEPTIDPNIGGIDQALTTRAVHSILSGALPWWNHFEGFGAPLAGEMQSSALFPLAFLVALPNGNILIEVVLAVAAGIGMLLLSKQLGLRPGAALVGAITFQFCGTFSWLTGAWTYSIAWLPFLVLGVELCRSTNARYARAGILTIAASIVFLLSSGFIETAYLEGLAGVAWSIARLLTAGSARLRFATRVLTGGLLGAALGSPIIVAFADTLATSAVGPHASGYAGLALPPSAMLQKLLPYIYGPIFASKQAVIAWSVTGGYVGLALPSLAVAGLLARREASIRIACGLIALFGFAAIFGGPLQGLLMLVPGIKYTAFFRYIDPAIAFAMSVLAALAINDLLERSTPVRWRLFAGLGSILAFTAIAYAFATPYISSAQAEAADGDLFGWHWFSLAAAVVAIVAFGTILATRTSRQCAAVLGVVTCLEAVVFLVIPTLSYPRSATIAIGGVRYLQQHLYEQRFYSLGPIGPNYGSYFGIADIDYSDLPVPARSSAYIASVLDSGADPTMYFAGMTRPGITRAENLNIRLDAFARVGVRYVVLPSAAVPPSAHLQPRYHDAVMAIYEVPGVSPYFRAPGCRITSSSRDEVTANCRAASQLCRLELNAPGWNANVAGNVRAPADCDGIFQSVPIPNGRSRITFTYAPPHINVALFVAGAALVVVLSLVASLVLSRDGRIRRMEAPTQQAPVRSN